MGCVEQRGKKFGLSFRYGGKKFRHSLGVETQWEADESLGLVERNLRLLEQGILELPRGADLPLLLLSGGKLSAKPEVADVVTLGGLIELVTRQESRRFTARCNTTPSTWPPCRRGRSGGGRRAGSDPAGRDIQEVMMAGGTWKREDVATGYLSERSHFIPDRPRQLEVLVRVIRSAEQFPTRILDLGAGDGVLLECLLEAFPEASGVAVDFSPAMVEKASERLSKFGPRATVAEGDLGSPDWLRGVEPPFNAIVSGLAIHHLTDDRKRALYREVFELLRPGGTFLNCEHVASRGPWGQGMYDDAVSEQLWRRRQDQGESVSFEEVRTEYVSRPDRADNRLALVEDQCGWLRDIGFKDVDCFWKYFELAIFGGRRI